MIFPSVGFHSVSAEFSMKLLSTFTRNLVRKPGGLNYYLCNNVCWLDNMMIWFLVCHLVGVSSACTNPVIYGLLNLNIQQEYRNILVNIFKIPRLLQSKPPQPEIIELQEAGLVWSGEYRLFYFKNGILIKNLKSSSTYHTLIYRFDNIMRKILLFNPSLSKISIFPLSVSESVVSCKDFVTMSSYSYTTINTESFLNKYLLPGS